MQLRVLAAAGIVAGLMAWPGVAHADGTLVLVDDDKKVDLSVADDGAGEASVTLANTGTDISVVASLVDDEATECAPKSEAIKVEGNTEKAIKIEFADCDPASEEPIAFKLTPKDDPGTILFELDAAPPNDASPDWTLLYWFLRAAGGGLAMVVAAYVVWMLIRDKPDPRGRIWWLTGLFEPLPKLESSWKFTESWASNATVVAAAFTGVFGATDVATSILGKSDAKDLLAIVAVATAGALALAGIAPMLLQALRTWCDEGAAVTPIGLMVAGVITVAATGGELGVVVSALRDTKVGAQDWILAGGIVGGALLAGYAFAATVQNLRAGEEKPPTAETPPSIVELIKYLVDWISHQAAMDHYRSLDATEQQQEPVPQKPAQIEFPVTSSQRESHSAIL